MLTPFKVQSLFSFLIIAATSLATFTASVQSFAGDGRNGPTMAGDAIPVHVDRALTVNQLVAVTKSCDFDSLKQLYSQVFRVSRPNLEIMNSRAEFDNDVYVGHMVRLYTGLEVREPDSRNGLTLFSEKGDKGLFIKVRTGVAEFLIAGPLNMTTMMHVRPFFSFDNSFPEGSYDGLGQLRLDRPVVKGLIVKLPKTGLQPIASFTSADFHQKTELEFNVEAYTNCLLSGIQHVED